MYIYIFFQRISPENSLISSNFKAEFTQSLKELLHQELWLHKQLGNLSDSPGPLRATGMALSVRSTLKTNVREQFPLGEDKSVQGSKAETTVAAQPRKAVPPFLGRSQSLLNIPLNLEVSRPVTVEPRPPQPAHSQPVAQAPQATRRTVACKRPASSKQDAAKSQCVPHHTSSREGCKGSHRREGTSTMPHPTRSKSVDAKAAAAAISRAQQYDVSQLELFATIHQSRQALSSRTNSKNLMVTSALVGVRQSDRNGSRSEPTKTGGNKSLEVADSKPAAIKNPSGHLCVVQALVHQDGDVVKNSTVAPVVAQQRHRAWEPLYEPGHDRRSRSDVEAPMSTGETSIELTADQVRQLLKAISAAQAGSSAGSLGGCWAAGLAPQPQHHAVAHIPERDAGAVKPIGHPQRPLQRNDSFEGHEEAVRMLVGAIQEIQQLCTDDNKKPGESS